MSNKFYDHLDICKQCREHPFDLCEEGQVLLEDNVNITRQVLGLPLSKGKDDSTKLNNR